MVIINLLPWRIDQKKREAASVKRFLLAAFFFSILLIGMLYSFLTMRLHSMLVKKTNLSAQWLTLKNNRQEIVPEDLQEKRILRPFPRPLVNDPFFWRLEEKRPYDVCFNEVLSQNNHFLFSGTAYSMYDFNQFLKTWPARKLFDEVRVTKIIFDADILHFQLEAKRQHAEI